MPVGPSFDEVFAAEFASLHAYLAKRVGPVRADDLTAETFAIAYRRWSDLDASRPARPWLYGIAAKLVQRQWRNERRMLRAYARTGLDPAFTEDDVPVDRIGVRAVRPAVADALASLRREQREVLLLYAWAELNESEIAEALSIPVGTVKSRLSRAREHMRNRLDAIGQVEVETPTAAKERR